MRDEFKEKDINKLNWKEFKSYLDDILERN